MADERCEWLDKDTAERLLSGGPVGAVDDHARAQAARLHAALNGAAGSAARSEIDELPGEKAAVEAFRLAREGAADPRPAPVGRTWVRTPWTVSAAGRWGRPVRFSIAAVVAGCALSGVAVAAGAGMLPSPFGRSEPMPASSVSSAATPRPLLSETPSGAATSASPGPDSATPSGETPGPEERGPRPSPPAGEAGGDASDRGRSDRGADPTAGTGRASGTGSQNRPTPSDGGQHSGDEVFRKVAAACRDYRAGRVEGERRRSLEAKAGGAKNIEKFCGRVLGTGGSGGSGGHRISFTPSSPLAPATPATSPTPTPSPSLSASASPSPSATLNFPASPSPSV